MGNALQWFRRRQHGFARVLLAAFCAAWLQFAVLPCAMAHAAPPLSSSDDHADGHGGAPDGAEATAPCHGTIVVDDDCLYCLGDDPAGDCDYPREARADLRDTVSSLPPLALDSFSAVAPALQSDGGVGPDRRHARGPADTSSSLQTLYCRRLR
jgi:hypothetical protein